MIMTHIRSLIALTILRGDDDDSVICDRPDYTLTAAALEFESFLDRSSGLVGTNSSSNAGLGSNICIRRTGL